MQIWSVILLLGWGALSLGATRPWGYVPLLAGSITYGLVALFKRKRVQHLHGGLYLSLAMFCTAVCIQLIPLPGHLATALSPAAASSVSESIAVARPLSVHPVATTLGLAFVISFCVFFVGMARTLDSDGAFRLAAGLAGLGTIVGFIGIAETSTSWRGFYAMTGLPKPPDTSPMGPFGSRNHYAGWLLMTLAVSIGYLFARIERGATHGDLVPAHRGLTGPVRTLAAASGLTVMAVALVQTRSRAGLLGLAFSLIVMGVVLMRRRTASTSRTLMAMALLLPLTGIFVTGVEPIAKRFTASSWTTAHGRLPIWQQGIAIARDFTIVGSGLNTYQRVVELYPSPDLDEPYEGAHNDYLQLAIEGGLLIGLPALCTLAFFIRETRLRLQQSQNGAKWIRIGAVLGLVLIACQETVDFSLQVPGNVALFVVLAAIAIHRAPLVGVPLIKPCEQ